MEETILSTSFPIFYVNSLEDYFGVMRDCLSVGYNYPTPLAIKVPKEITEQWKMDDIGEIWRARNLLKVQHRLGSETNS